VTSIDCERMNKDGPSSRTGRRRRAVPLGSVRDHATSWLRRRRTKCPGLIPAPWSAAPFGALQVRRRLSRSEENHPVDRAPSVPVRLASPSTAAREQPLGKPITLNRDLSTCPRASAANFSTHSSCTGRANPRRCELGTSLAITTSHATSRPPAHKHRMEPKPDDEWRGRGTALHHLALHA